MGWDPAKTAREPFLILSTQGGLRGEDGRPVALGYHTGHWEVGLLVREAAEELDRLGVLPFAAHVSDPCDGRTQGTTGMFDSLAYRNDAAVVLRRLVRSLPTRRGVIAVGTCDKGLPAMTMALASFGRLAGAVIPGGVTLPPRRGEDAGAVQTLGARFAHGLVTLDEAADLGCRACATPGGGCQFLGTAATAQVVAEAFGLTVPHAALAPSGQPIWLDVARRTAQAVHAQWSDGRTLADVLTPMALENAMLVHAAFGGSTNLLIHIPAVAHAAGLARPTVDDWRRINRSVPRLVDALPNGPNNHPTVRVFPCRRRPRSDASSPPARSRRYPDAYRPRRHVGRRPRRVGGRRAASPATRSPHRARRSRPRRRHLPSRSRAGEGHDLDRLLPGREPGAARERDQEHRNRPAQPGRRRRLPNGRAGRVSSPASAT